MKIPLRFAGLAAACLATLGGYAQDYPVRGIRYLVPQAPGGSSDTLARVVAPRLADALGQQVVVDNRPGATGIIGSDLVGELLNAMTGIKLVHIPYKGSPPALIDVLGGRVAVMVSTLAPAMPQVKSGRLRALAITSIERSKATPEIPTVAESGVAGYEAISWQGVLAPAGTPRGIVQRLNSELRKVIAPAEPRRQLAEQGYEPLSGMPEAFDAYIKSEIAKWTRVVRSAGLQTLQNR